MAESWQFASFWCITSLLSGSDDSGGGPNASLQDLDGNFVQNDVQAMVGMVIYNTTTGLSGPVTAVTATTITATGVTWSNGDVYRIVTITGEEIATIEHYLDIAASDIHAAMAASDQCSCTLASWVAGFLSKLNIVDAAVYYNCPCGQPQITDEMRTTFLEWMTGQLENIRMGNIELCHGATGAEWPAIGWAEQSWTNWAAAGIIYNYELREG